MIDLSTAVSQAREKVTSLIPGRGPASRPGPAPVAPGKFRASPPVADLLPASVRASARDGRKEKQVVSGAGVVVALAACWWGLSVYQGQTAERELDAARAVNTDLLAEQAMFAPVTTLAVQTEALTATVRGQTETRVAHSELLAKFLEATEGRLNVTTLAMATTGVAECTSTDPFGDTVTIGCLTFGGEVTTEQGAADLVTALNSDESGWFIDAFIPSIGRNAAGVGATISGTVAVTSAAVMPDPLAPEATDPGTDTGTDGESAEPTNDESKES